MSILSNLTPESCATITIDCLNTFMCSDGMLSISAFQQNAKNLNQSTVQSEIDIVSRKIGEIRECLFQNKVPQIQFQDAHVIESVHGKRFHSLEITREGEEPDFIRTFPPHALLDRHRRFGTDDQQAQEIIHLPKAKQVFIRWFDSHMPHNAIVSPETELIFFKDDFSMSPGTPYLYQLLWELRRQGRFNLIVLGVCDEICNLRNVLVLLAALFNVIYIEDGTYPLDPEKRDRAIEYMRGFNQLSHHGEQFTTLQTSELIQHFESL